MSLPIIACLFLILLVAGYFLYGNWIAKQFSLNNQHVTPAHRQRDGIDFVPTKPFYLLGQHFSAIAAAGPIAGPIVACQVFGWVPALLWIGLGVVFIGAVHDFSSLTSSVRHGASSVAEMTKTHISSRAGIAVVAFIWIALVYIIVAFADITAGSFVSAIPEIEGTTIDFNPGGAVAAASVLYLLLAMIMGLVQRFLKPPLWILTIVFVPLAFAVSYFATHVSHGLLLSHKTWCLLIVLYCAVGSVLPVWLLLQPRGFLGGFILYFALAVGIFGIFFGGYDIQQPSFKAWQSTAGWSATSNLFPFLFVTIACGACSGFHGLVCSGTTSKQIDKEKDMHVIGYGAMLAEALVAFIALAIIMIASSDQIAGLKPGTIYGNGIGKFITLIIGPEHLPFAITLGAMAFSTFVFDTLDVSARLGRYLLQELTGWRGKFGATFATLVTILIPGLILYFAADGAWVKYWTLFGASNQLLAALTLLVITVWLYKSGKSFWFTLLPMFFVLIITLWALLALVVANYNAAQGFDDNMINAVAASMLIGLAIFINISGWLTAKKIKNHPVA